jgi:hypothetical protein
MVEVVYPICRIINQSKYVFTSCKIVNNNKLIVGTNTGLLLIYNLNLQDGLVLLLCNLIIFRFTKILHSN